MKSLTSKFALIGVITLLGLLSLYPPREKLKLGIDLSGGTILVYDVRSENLPPGFKLDDLIAALKRRVNPEGVLDIPIRKVGGGNRIEIILPVVKNDANAGGADASADEVENVKRRLTDVGSLEFRILASRGDTKDQAVVTRAIDKDGLAKPPARYLWAKLGEVVTGTNPKIDESRLTIADPAQRWVRNAYSGKTVLLTGKTASGVEQSVPATVTRNSTDTLTLAAPFDLATVTSYRLEYNPSEIREGDPDRPSPMDPIIREQKVGPGRTERFILVRDDRHDVSGEYLNRTFATTDQKLQPAVGFEFDRAGARKFRSLTREHLPRENGAFKYRLAILLDNVVMSAPGIESEIGESGIINGGDSGFKAKDVEYLTGILEAGSLPASLNPEPLQEEKIGPTLGEDTIAKGLRAIWISMLVVPLFMILYYRKAGVVAVVSLVLNVILLVGSMALLQATFTLPGLAGLALTIGMAVDANVLIFERMREEKDRGAGVPQQIRNGFNRAWTTIFDANVTTVLSALVLWRVGTEEVRGFATTLVIGLIWNLFTAVFVSRVLFEFLHQQGWLRRIAMNRVMGKTNIDFIGPRKLFMVGSLIVIALGLGAVAMRGPSILNIDFTGGTLVTIRLNSSDEQVKSRSATARAAYVRDKAKVLPDVTVETLNVGGEASGLRYNIRTTEVDEKKVRDKVIEAFGPSLQKVELAVGPPSPIPAAPETAVDVVGARFPGGTQYALTLNIPEPPSRVASAFARVLDDSKIANAASRFEVINPKSTASDFEATSLALRTDLDPATAAPLLDLLKSRLRSDRNLLFERLTNFGGVVAGETRTLALVATFASWVIIAAYLWFRFKSLTYGLAAIIAVVHDVLITLGAVAATYWIAQIPVVGPALGIDQFKIDLPMIAAFLTLIGFSVNDTIVIFDRIRELKGKSPYLTAQMINDAVNQTLSRTILTSLTAWLVVVILYAFGGEGLHGFAFTLVIGLISGTYSTIYIASPILVDWAGRPKDTKAGGKVLVGSR